MVPLRTPSVRRRAALTACLVLAGATTLLASRRNGIAIPPAAAHREQPARPANCRDVEPGPSLRSIVEGAHDGDALCLRAGTYPGPIELTHAITLWGPRDAMVRSSGEGTTIRVTSPRARLLGFTVDGSGGRYDLEDAAVQVQADDVEVRALRVVHAVYGILVQRARRVTVRGNEITGIDEQALGLRGDGIRLWETRDSVVEENLVEHSRDVVVWYSPSNRVVRNVVRRGRYGTHFMYSSDCLAEGNTYQDDVVGIFVMYSHGITIRDNLVADAAGAAGMALGLKDAGNVTVVRNRFVHDTLGAFIDGSPATNGERDRFEDNQFVLTQTAVMFHASQSGNTFVRNSFRDNRVAVAVEGGGDALETNWDGNFFDAYQGYDLDGDGVGDVPFELRSLATDLTSRDPSLELFTGTPALALVDIAGRVAPLFEPHTILIDRHPRMEPLTRESSDAHRDP
jgi:nitrous oxidase accessory protein